MFDLALDLVPQGKMNEMKNVTIFRGDWYAACYNYYDGLYYDYYEDNYMKKINNTMEYIIENTPKDEEKDKSGKKNKTNSSSNGFSRGEELMISVANDIAESKKTIATAHLHVNYTEVLGYNPGSKKHLFSQINETHMYNMKTNRTIQFRTNVTDKEEYILKLGNDFKLSANVSNAH